jgi:hypothetical protein
VKLVRALVVSMKVATRYDSFSLDQARESDGAGARIFCRVGYLLWSLAP